MPRVITNPVRHPQYSHHSTDNVPYNITALIALIRSGWKCE